MILFSLLCLNLAKNIIKTKTNKILFNEKKNLITSLKITDFYSDTTHKCCTSLFDTFRLAVNHFFFNSSNDFVSQPSFLKCIFTIAHYRSIGLSSGRFGGLCFFEWIQCFLNLVPPLSAQHSGKLPNQAKTRVGYCVSDRRQLTVFGCILFCIFHRQ